MTKIIFQPSNKLKPLSEEEVIHHTDPFHLSVEPGETYSWNEVTSLSPWERRLIDLDIHIGKNSRGEMLRVFFLPVGARLTVQQTVRVEKGGYWQGCIVIRGGGSVHIRRAIYLQGAKARAQTVCLGSLSHSGRVSVADEMFAQVPEVHGEITTALVLNDSSYSAARARLVVANEADNSRTFERLDHLLLGEKAKAEVIPEIEVKTDKVKCGHAATTSKPDDNQKWYLNSRGLNDHQTNLVLTRAFLEPVLVQLPEQEREEIRKIIFA